MSKVTNSQNWSDEDLEYLYKARSESVPYDVIGRELSRTAEACKSKWLKTEWDKMSFFRSSDTRVKKSKIVAFEEKMNKTVENKLEMFSKVSKLDHPRQKALAYFAAGAAKESFRFEKKEREMRLQLECACICVFYTDGLFYF